MNALLTFIPFIFIRLVVFRWMNLDAFKKAQTFAPVTERQRIYFIVYQICQLLLLILPVFYPVGFRSLTTVIGLVFYSIGLLILSLSIYAFAKPTASSLIQSGIYQYSRHPMYVGYFFFYLGLGIWMQSILYLILLLVFQICTHQMILAEEKWCAETFGQEYLDYRKHVRRYL